MRIEAGLEMLGGDRVKEIVLQVVLACPHDLDRRTRGA